MLLEGLTRRINPIERFNTTLCQRISRLVRDALSFSKKLANHIGAIKDLVASFAISPNLLYYLPIRSIDFYYSEFQAAHGLIFPRQIQNLRSGESK